MSWLGFRLLMPRLLLTVKEAADALGVSQSHIKRLIQEAELPKSRWRFGRELMDLAPEGAQRRMVRVNVNAVVPGLDAAPSRVGR